MDAYMETAKTIMSVEREDILDLINKVNEEEAK
jgi:hypothetical protein